MQKLLPCPFCGAKVKIPVPAWCIEALRDRQQPAGDGMVAVPADALRALLIALQPPVLDA